MRFALLQHTIQRLKYRKSILNSAYKLGDSRSRYPDGPLNFLPVWKLPQSVLIVQDPEEMMGEEGDEAEGDEGEEDEEMGGEFSMDDEEMMEQAFFEFPPFGGQM